MNSPRLLRAEDYPCMPWKNGGGSTLEIARDAGDELDSFGWRLSIADVRESGAFSLFAGYQRLITVLEGAGMRLDVDGKRSRDLTPLDSFVFDGGAKVECELIDGPIRDFNLIYSPAHYCARLQWLRVEGELTLFSSASTVLLFAAQSSIGVSMDGEVSAELNAHDCLHIESPENLAELKLIGRGVVCCLIELINR